MELIGMTQLIRFGAALVFVIALMAGLGMVMKRIEGGKHNFAPLRKKRLKIIEMQPIDSRRRLVLIQRDNVEHLLILGPNGETVVESGIEATQQQQADITVIGNDDTKAA